MRSVRPCATEHQGSDNAHVVAGTSCSSPAFLHLPGTAFPEHGQPGITVPKDPFGKCVKAEAIKVQSRE